MEKSELDILIDRLFESRPKKFFHQLDETKAGISCMMTILANNGSPMTAGDLSKAMEVSTARIAVLLKKMASKELIVRQGVANDARKVLITLSDKGKQLQADEDEQRRSFTAKIIQRVGIEDFERFIEISNKIRKAVEEEISKNC